MRVPSRILVGCAALLGLGLTAQPANAAFFIGSVNGSEVARVDFVKTGTTLTITLTNIHENPTTQSALDETNGNGVLTALFFAGGGSIVSANTAMVSTGSDVIQYSGSWNGGTVGDVSGEWGFKNSSFTLDGETYHFGLSSSGFGAPADFGSSLINPSNQLTPPSPDGPGWGVVAEGTTGSGSNNAMGRPYIRNSVTFELTVDAAFNVDAISQVRFQYGTSLSEGHIFNDTPFDDLGIVPAPAGLVLLATAIPVLGLRRVLRRKAA